MHLKQPHFSFYFSHVDERNIILSAWKLIRKLTDKFQDEREYWRNWN
jgi:hypothetical protein